MIVIYMKLLHFVETETHIVDAGSPSSCVGGDRHKKTPMCNTVVLRALELVSLSSKLSVS